MRVICIDGPAGVGKSSVARRLAEVEGLAYLDSGAMYRAVTLVALRRGVALTDADALARVAADLAIHLGADGRVTVDGEDVSPELRSQRVSQAVSHVAKVPAVREVMVRHQRDFARRHLRVVAEGRDMGTVVFPDAELKIYLDADPAERVRRRLGEARPAEEGGEGPESEETLKDRDRIDSTRPVAPLRPAPDAWRLDTTHLTLDEVVAQVRARVRSGT